MDPNQTLAEIRSLVDRLNRLGQDDDLIGYRLGVDLAERVTALDEWMTRGGFTPSDWRGGL